MAVSHLNALVLNADFSPISTHPLSKWSFEDTVRNVLKGSVIVLEEYDVEFRSANFNYRPPSVVALKKYIRLPQRVAFNRKNIFLRDDFRCGYCGEVFNSRDLTFDHVIPQSRGGPTNFENIISACMPCNTAKGDKMNVKPLWQPYTPTVHELARRRPSSEIIHESWRDYLYWSGVLDQD